MLIYILIVCAFIVGYVIGWIKGRKKFSTETAVQVIQNLKDNIKIIEITCEEQKAYLSQKNTDLKGENMRLLEENKELKK